MNIYESTYGPEDQDTYASLLLYFFSPCGVALVPPAAEREVTLCSPFCDASIDDGLRWGGNFISCHCKENSKPAKFSLLAEAEEEEEKVTY